jgi:hypothetical protein
VDRLVDRPNVGPQLMGGQVTAAHRLAADEHFPPCRDGDSAHDKSPKLKRL